MSKDHPQRIMPIAAPGERLKRLTATYVRLRLKADSASNPIYLNLLRQLPCLKCGLEPCNEAAHLRVTSGAHGKKSALGKRPQDRWALPLCPGCHRNDTDSQHKVGERLFWYVVGLNPVLVASALYEARGDIVRMRAIVLLAAAERR